MSSSIQLGASGDLMSQTILVTLLGAKSRRDFNKDSLRATTPTYHPSCIRIRATSCPIPDDAPTTIAFFIVAKLRKTNIKSPHPQTNNFEHLLIHKIKS